MADLNTWTGTGRLGADPKKHNGNTPCCSFNLAISGFNDTTTWVRCVLWGNIVDTAMKYLKKGYKVGLSGRLQENSWTDDQGNERKAIELHARDMALLEPKKDGQQQGQNGGQRQQGGNQPRPAQQGGQRQNPQQSQAQKGWHRDQGDQAGPNDDSEWNF